MTQCSRLRLSSVFLLSLVAVGIPWSDASAQSSPEQVAITDINVRMSEQGPVVLLQAEGRVVPIMVDMTVALSIQGALSGEKPPRPMSHDLMHAILETYGGRVVQTVITLKGGTYYGALTVAFGDRVTVFDSRSSDSIALAVHFKAPILVGRDVLKSGESIQEEAQGKGAEL
jgi:bifunctional DNase/RNase